jgi:DNA-binding NtrC family response regulator
MEDKKTVLIVDDDAVILEMLRSYFSREGFECSVAENGRAAFNILQATSFDLLLTDMVMPEMDGIELTEKAKKLYPYMPVVIMTGYNGSFSEESADEAGVADYIIKPFSLDELEEKVKKAITD